MKTIRVALVGIIFAIAGAGTAAAQILPVPVLPHVSIYSVKFVCGLQGINPDITVPAEPPVKPGNYATVINIHNYHRASVVMRWKAVPAVSVLNVPANPLVPLFSSLITLAPDQVADISCSEIEALSKAPGPFVTGMVEIQSRPDLSVTAVYTSQGCGDATAGQSCPPAGSPSIEVVPQREFIDTTTAPPGSTTPANPLTP